MKQKLIMTNTLFSQLFHVNVCNAFCVYFLRILVTLWLNSCSQSNYFELLHNIYLDKKALKDEAYRPLPFVPDHPNIGLHPA